MRSSAAFGFLTFFCFLVVSCKGKRDTTKLAIGSLAFKPWDSQRPEFTQRARFFNMELTWFNQSLDRFLKKELPKGQNSHREQGFWIWSWHDSLPWLDRFLDEQELPKGQNSHRDQGFSIFFNLEQELPKGQNSQSQGFSKWCWHDSLPWLDRFLEASFL